MNVQNSAATSVPARLAAKQGPTCAPAARGCGGEIGEQRQNHGEYAHFGEQLLPGQDHHQKPDRIAEARRAASKEPEGNPRASAACPSREKLIERPPAKPDHQSETAGRSICLLPLLPDDLVDRPDRQAGVLGDRALLALDGFLLGYAHNPASPFGRPKGETHGEAARLRKWRHGNCGDRIAPAAGRTAMTEPPPSPTSTEPTSPASTGRTGQIYIDSSPTTRATTAGRWASPATEPCSTRFRGHSGPQFDIELHGLRTAARREPAHVDCRPKGLFLDLPVNGKRVVFAENVFYQFRGGKIAEVWSMIHKAAIEAQLRGRQSRYCLATFVN